MNPHSRYHLADHPMAAKVTEHRDEPNVVLCPRCHLSWPVMGREAALVAGVAHCCGEA